MFLLVDLVISQNYEKKINSTYNKLSGTRYDFSAKI